MNHRSNAPPAWTRFAIAATGGASGWMFCHPMDVVKTRMQLLRSTKNRWNAGPAAESTRRSSLGMFRDIWRVEGMRGMYSGLSAGITRQFTYTTARIGLYETIRETCAPLLGIDTSAAALGSGIGFAFKLASGLVAGATACVLCCPVEVALVRMQADANRPLMERRNYRNVVTALLSIVKREGIAGAYAGVGALVTRGAIVSMAQLATYDTAKAAYQQPPFGFNDGVLLHLCSGVTAGFVYCAVSLPIDNVKSRLMDQTVREDGTVAVSGIRDAFRQSVAADGVASLWRGFPAYFARGGGHTILMFLFVEQYRKMVNEYYGAG